MRFFVFTAMVLFSLQNAAWVFADGCLSGTCGQSEPKQFHQHKANGGSVPINVNKWTYEEQLTGRPVNITPERTVWVEISSTDINRVVCMNGTISDVNFSKEKGLVVKTQGKEAFLKLRAIEEEGKVKYSNIPVEVYITCNGKTYGFIGRPKKIPSKTIYLKDPAYNIDKAAAALGTSEIDQAVIKIFLAVYRDVIPESWERMPGGKRYQLNGLMTFNRANWKIPGVGIIVREFEISNRQNQMVPIDEKDFLDPGLIKNPIAISIQHHIISSGANSRAVVIEKFIED